MKLKLAVLVLVFGFLLVMSYGCASSAKPVLTEELKWNNILNTWSDKAYASRDFRAGFIQAAVKPWVNQMPVVLNQVLTDLAKFGDPVNEEFKAGSFGGTTLAFYGVLSGQGTKWLLDQLFNLNMIPAGLSALVGM